MFRWLCVHCGKPSHFCNSTSQGWKAATSRSAEAFLVENCAVTKISLKVVNACQILSYCRLQNERTDEKAAQKLAVALYGDAQVL